MGQKAIIFIILLVVSLAVAIGVVRQMSNESSGRFHSSTSYIYLLQDVDFDLLKSTDFDVGVVDPDEADLSADQLERLTSQGKTLLAYLSIGEAEDYRSYWEPDWKIGTPDFIHSENPDWEGNYKVEFWDTQWQQLVFDRVDKLVVSGYDGVYLDIIDAYEFFKEAGDTSARTRMIDFVRGISDQAKFSNPEFLIVPQNSPELIVNSDYLAAIDGLGKEDTWFFDDIRREESDTQSELNYLARALEAGKFILAIDYPTNEAKQCEFTSNAHAEGFVATVGSRELNNLTEVNCR